MISIKKLFERLRGGRPAPIINTQYGPVTENARAQCALNMREDPLVKFRVEAVLIRQYGEQQGMRLARERYPEAYANEPRHKSS